MNFYSFDYKYKLGNDLLNFYLPYRYDLKFDDDITFGFEIEFTNAKLEQVQYELKYNKLNNWQAIFESTTSYFDKYSRTKGGEVISPVLNGNEKSWKELEKVCDIIKLCLGETNDLTAGHIHIGSQIFKNKECLNNFLFLWASFEDVIKRFFSCEHLNYEGNNIYAKDCFEDFSDAFFDIDFLLQNRSFSEHNSKSYAVSFYYFKSFDLIDKNTVEFRKIKGSLEKEIWQNNINFLINFIKWSTNIEKEDLKEIKTKFHSSEITLSNNDIDFNKALFLADKVFGNEMDKLCFLKQYFKDFYLYDGTKEKVRMIKND